MDFVKKNIDYILFFLILLVFCFCFYGNEHFIQRENFVEKEAKLSDQIDIIDENNILLGQATLNNYIPESAIKLDLTQFKSDKNNLFPGNRAYNIVSLTDSNNHLLGTGLLCPPGCSYDTVHQECIALKDCETYNNYRGNDNRGIIVINNK
jgi:hypothetical protein